MFEIILTKNNQTRPLLVVETEQSAIDFIAEREASGVFGEVGSYSLAYQDVSAKLILENKIKIRKIKREFGESLIDKIAVMNEVRGLTVEQTDAFNSIPLIVSFREHLWAGNIGTFATKLASSNVSAFFSDLQKNLILQECVDFLDKIDG